MMKIKNAAIAALAATAVGIGGASVASAATLEPTINAAGGNVQATALQRPDKPTPPRPGDRPGNGNWDCPNDGPRRDGTGGPQNGTYGKNKPGQGCNQANQQGKRGKNQGKKDKRGQRGQQGPQKPGKNKPGANRPGPNWKR